MKASSFAPWYSTRPNPPLTTRNGPAPAMQGRAPGTNDHPAARASAWHKSECLFDSSKSPGFPASVERSLLRAVNADMGKPTPSGDGLDPSTSIAGRRHGSEMKHRRRGSRHTFRLEHRTERGLILVRLHLLACLRVIDRHRPEQLMGHRWGIDSCPKETASDSGVHDGSRAVWEPGAGCWFWRRSRRSAARISFSRRRSTRSAVS